MLWIGPRYVDSPAKRDALERKGRPEGRSVPARTKGTESRRTPVGERDQLDVVGRRIVQVDQIGLKEKRTPVSGLRRGKTAYEHEGPT